MLALLVRAGGRPVWTRRRGKGIDELVYMMLSQNTSAANAASGYRQLRRRFPRWSQVLDAPVEQVQRQIAVCGLSRLRARRLQELLRAIRDERGGGRITLEFLSRWDPARAYEYLLSFFGIGPRTAACTLLFSFGMPVFPVDKQIQRIAWRSGLARPRSGEPVIERELTPLIPPEDRYAAHVLLHRHGKKFCRPRNPKCQECVLLECCAHGKQRVKHEPPPKMSRRLRPVILSRHASAGIAKRSPGDERSAESRSGRSALAARGKR